MTLLNLGWLNGKQFQIDANILVTGRTCIIGASGSGKSYAIGVICEELLKNKIPFTIVDTEGEYFSLKEKYEVIWIGEDPKCDINWNIDIEELGKYCLESPPLILDLSETENPREKLNIFLNALYNVISVKRFPYLLILEEADRFVPQSGYRLKIIDEIARRGRKRGLGLILCTQRPSLVDKNILGQCSNQLIGKLVIKNDLQAIAHFFPSRKMLKQLPSLVPGNFFALGGFFSEPTIIKVRERETRHGGYTPKLSLKLISPSKEILNKLLEKEKIEKVEKTHLGLKPLFNLEDISNLVKRSKKYILFGKEEKITSIKLIYRPFIEIKLRVQKGILKKEKYGYLILDSVSGKIINLEEKLKIKKGFEDLFGLKSNQIKVLFSLSKNKEYNLKKISKKVKLSEDILSKILKSLEKKGFVISKKIGRIKAYKRVIDIPKVKLSDYSIILRNINLSKSKVQKVKINEYELEEIIKGIFSNSIIEHFKIFYYPFYLVELTLGNKRREIFLDGRNGNKISI